MKSRFVIGLAGVISVLSAGMVPSAAFAEESSQKLNEQLETEHVSGELVVQVQDGVSIYQTTASRFGYSHEKISDDTYLVQMPFWVSTKYALSQFSKDASIEVAEPNFVYKKLSTPDDALLDSQWGLFQGGGADVVGAWDQGVTGSADVVIAVLDDGVENLHPDLAASMWVNPGEIAGDGLDNDSNGLDDDIYGWDFAWSTSDVKRDNPDYDHGTHVAGIIAAQANNAQGISGVAPGVKIMALGIFDDSGATLSAILGAFDYVAQMKQYFGINIVATNNSWGGGGYSQLIKNQIDRTGNLGILNIAAAGNEQFDNDSPEYYVDGDGDDFERSFPASFMCYDENRDWDCVVSVASMDPDGQMSNFSNYGEYSVDLGAPGGQIVSTVPLDYQGATVSPGYASFSGTSMASPFVTGAVALCASANPSLSPGQLRSKLLDTTTYSADVLRLVSSDGVLDASAYVASCLESAPAAMTGAPTNLQAEQTIDNGSVKLSWADTVSGETGFIVRYGVDNQGVCSIAADQIVAHLSAGMTSFVDNGYLDGSTYCFEVEAVRGDQVSHAATFNGLTISFFDTVIMSGWLYQDNRCEGVAGVKLTYSAAGYPDSVAYPDNNNVFFGSDCSSWVEDAFYSIVLPRSQNGTMTISNPDGESRTGLTTMPQLPANLNVEFPLSVSTSLPAIDLSVPLYHSVVIEVLDRIDTQPVTGAEFSSELALGGQFGCTRDYMAYQPLIGNAAEYENLTFGYPNCTYNPAGLGSNQVRTGPDGLAFLNVFDQSVQGSSSRLEITARESGGGPRFVEVSVPTNDMSYELLNLRSTPRAPRSPTLEAGAGSVTVSLATPSDDGGASVSSFSVQTSSSASGTFSQVSSGTCSGQVSASATACTITGLSGDTEVFVRYAATNIIGVGLFSEIDSATPSAPLATTGGGGGGGGGGGAAPVPVVVAPVGMEGLASRLEIPPGTTLEIPGGLREVLLSGTGWEVGFEPAGRISESGVLSVPIGASNPVSISGYRPKSEVVITAERQSVSAAGTGFMSAQNVTTLGTFKTDIEGNLEEDIKLPSSLDTGDYKLVISGSSLLTGPVRLALPIKVTTAVDMGFAVWTKKFGSSQGKMYAKNPGGAGKVVFKLNGKEIAWVNAVDGYDPKLRRVTEGPMTGVSYLVRTVKFSKGKNALEIFVDGKRVWRGAYTLK